MEKEKSKIYAISIRDDNKELCDVLDGIKALLLVTKKLNLKTRAHTMRYAVVSMGEKLGIEIPDELATKIKM